MRNFSRPETLKRGKTMGNASDISDPNDPKRQEDPGAAIPRGDEAGIQSPTTTGGDASDELRTGSSEGPVTDVDRLEAERESGG
jgi:hypothetical protein